MRIFKITFICIIFIIIFSSNFISANDKSISVIIEVEGDLEEHLQYIKDHWPTIEIVTTYSELFNGMALKIPVKKVEKILSEPFIQGVHPVKEYESVDKIKMKDSEEIFPENKFSSIKELKNKISTSFVLPNDFNDTEFTGKGVKVAVIDTGIDWKHPDLQQNFRGGYDLVDLDDDPMETTPEEGIPTVHGSHVTGIIAANGQVQGVAPEAEVFVYRALGPGGMGTSIQVMAAMEEAVKQGVEIINLSLGSSVNGPDYPTSKSVNEASKRGIAVVVANGNTGPDNWTVGAPATASSAISVGAYEMERVVPYLYEPVNRKKITLKTMPNQQGWDLRRDDKTTTSINRENLNGKIWLMNDQNANVQKAVNNGAKAIIANEKFTENFSMIEDELSIPIAFISDEDMEWVMEHQTQFFKHYYEETFPKTATFSSRGPVTESWEVKPDIIAPGVNVLSTVPGGYAILSGTSMAAPHISGAIAVMKEAKPTWPNEKLMSALKTTAIQMTEEKQQHESFLGQGTGLGQIKAAIDTETIIDNPLLSLGKASERLNRKTTEMAIENTTNEEQTYTFQQPEKIRGIQWDLPLSFTLQPKEKRRLPISVTINEQLTVEEMTEGQLKLQRKNNTYQIPYFIVAEDVEHPIIAGFSIQRDEWRKEIFNYELYVTEPVKSVKVLLYHPDTMMNEGVLWESSKVTKGLNKGKIPRENIEQRGEFIAIIVAHLENGEIINEITTVNIE